MARAWIKQAVSHLGFHEGPGNITPFGAHYGLQGQPWCAMYVSYCCEKAGYPLPVMQAGMSDGFAAVYAGMQWAKANGFWRPSWEAKPGDAVVYGWDGPGSAPANMHVGFITDPGTGKGSTAHTIEGNRGDQVERQTYTVGETVVLGTIAITEILKPSKKPRKPKPAPQPRHPDHPSNSGPPLGKHKQSDVTDLTGELKHRRRRVPRGKGTGRTRLRRLAAQIRRLLGKGK